MIFSFVFFAFTFWVLGPIFLNYLKKKLPGHYSHEIDIDAMIRKQKERLRAQYGLQGDVQTAQLIKPSEKEIYNNEFHSMPPTKEIQEIFKEIQWGGGDFLKEIQQEITKNYSYTLGDSKVNSFILLCEKRKYLRFLTPEHRTSRVALKNYLVTLLIVFLLIEEMREKKFYIFDKIAKKLKISAHELALAFQIKILSEFLFTFRILKTPFECNVLFLL